MAWDDVKVPHVSVVSASDYNAMVAAIKANISLSSEITSALHQGESNYCYVCNNDTSRVSIVLPTTSAVGDKIELIGAGLGGWGIDQNDGQTVRIGDVVTTPGSGGHIRSGTQFECITIRCLVANLHWIAVSVVGNPTVI